jgi:hypothetical protein
VEQPSAIPRSKTLHEFRSFLPSPYDCGERDLGKGVMIENHGRAATMIPKLSDRRIGQAAEGERGGGSALVEQL